MRHYRKEAVVGYMGPASKMTLVGFVIAFISLLLKLLSSVDGADVNLISSYVPALTFWTGQFSKITFYITITLFALALIWALVEPDKYKICRDIKTALFIGNRGNPLNLKDGELLPNIQCKPCGEGQYKIIISAGTCPVESIEKVSSSVSSALQGRYENYAVTQAESDLAFNRVTFTIEDVTIDRSITAKSVQDLCAKDPTKLRVQNGTYIDLTTSGSNAPMRQDPERQDNRCTGTGTASPVPRFRRTRQWNDDY